jgi:heme a synthase
MTQQVAFTGTDAEVEQAVGGKDDGSMLGRMREWRPTLKALRWSCMTALVANTFIIVSGGAVRLTDSGLGCPTWPTCTRNSIVPTPALGIHGIVEFTNRMLTYVVCVAVGAAIIACVRWQPKRKSISRLSWSLFSGVVLQAVIGGISVRTQLSPIWVSIHLVVSMGLVAASYTLWIRTGEGDAAPTPVIQPYLRKLGFGLTAAVGAVIIVGTLVTGAGPHSGALDAAKRYPWSPANMTQLHADLVFLVVGLTIALWFGLKATGASANIADAVRDLFFVVMAQGVIGYVQYFTHLPVLLVGIHMFGACLVWIATWRVLLAMRERTSAEPSLSAAAAV